MKTSSSGFFPIGISPQTIENYYSTGDWYKRNNFPNLLVQRPWATPRLRLVEDKIGRKDGKYKIKLFGKEEKMREGKWEDKK